MSPTAERRLFQIAVLIAAIVPTAAGGAGVLQGPDMIHGLHNINPDLDSHFGYLSGLLLAMGVAFVICAAKIEKRAEIFRALGLIVVAGGLARLVELTRLGLPGGPHRFAYVMELVVVPLLLLWLRRIERIAGREPGRE